MSDSLLIQEITDLRARLSEAEAEHEDLRAHTARMRSAMDVLEARCSGLEYALKESRDFAGGFFSDLQAEKRKREEAERALRLLADSLNAWERKEFASTSEAVVVMRAMILRYGALLPTPEKKSQEKPDGV